MEDIINVLKEQFNKYPYMQIEDIFKLVYQQIYGPRHIFVSNDFDNVFKSLKEEAIINKNQEKEKEYIGNGYYRYNLVNDDNYLKELTNRFINSCKENKKPSLNLKETLYELSNYVYLFNIDKSTYLNHLKEYEKESLKPISHSKIYKEKYDPHYRIIKEEKMERSKVAIKYFKEGYNCCQSVVLAFKDLVNIDESSLLKIASSFGGGIARLRETCGTISAIGIVIGLLYGYDTPDTSNIKNEHYKRIQELALSFENKNKSLVCRELLKKEIKHDNYISSVRDESFYIERPCVKLIEDVTLLIEQYIKKQGTD